MLDLKKLESEIDSFLANETAETYTELFKKTDSMGFAERVEISGGYIVDYDCEQSIVSNKPHIPWLSDDNSDFFDLCPNIAA